MGYVEGIGQRRCLDIVEGMRARSLGKMREGGSEGLDELFIGLLRSGSGRRSAMVQAWARGRAWRSRGAAGSRQDGETHRLRNMAGKLGAAAQAGHEHREVWEVRLGDGEAAEVT